MGGGGGATGEQNGSSTSPATRTPTEGNGGTGATSSINTPTQRASGAGFAILVQYHKEKQQQLWRRGLVVVNSGQLMVQQIRRMVVDHGPNSDASGAGGGE